MQRIDGRLVYSASDLNDYLECRRLTGLSAEVALDLRAEPADDDQTRRLLAEKGIQHERNYLERQKDVFGAELVAFDERADNTAAGLQAAEGRTVEAMRRGVRLIYQPTFFDGTFLGRADFLRRVAVPSALGSWSYEVIDTKLALATKGYFLVQICNYSEHLDRIQGVMPQHGYIVLGSGEERAYRLADYLAYYRHLKESFLHYVESDAGRPDAQLPYPVECPRCETCKWNDACESRRDADDHLSLVAFMRADQIKRLHSAGITTLATLAAATDAPYKMTDKTFVNLREQARQQHLHRQTVRNGSQPQHFFRFKPFDPQTGFARLPQPSAGDVFFDMEGDPLYRADRGLEYLWGYYLPLEGTYRPIWSTRPQLERAAFEQFVDAVMERLEQHPELHIYHYGSYEPARMRRLMGEYGTRENEINQLLRRGVFCDLYNVVRQGLWISQPSYSIKKLEVFYGFNRTSKTKRGDDSILMFEAWLASGDDGILEDIRLYNEEDCRSTYELLQWLRKLRGELSATLGHAIAWFTVPDAAEKPDDDEVTQTERLLLNDMPAPDSMEQLRSWSDDFRARWLLGNLQRYHRREQRPEWWKYFERLGHVENLEEFDDEAIGGLRYRCDIAAYKAGAKDRNFVYTFEFPPQEHHVGTKPTCPDAKKGAGEIIDMDRDKCVLQLKLAGGLRPESLRALIPSGPPSDRDKRAAMEDLGKLYLSGELQSRYPAAFDILLVRRPRLRAQTSAAVQPAQVTREAVSAIVARLDSSYLFVQGPPGSGKSTTGAWTIVDLLQAGKRVAIAAQSHKAVHNLLRKIEQTAQARNFRFNGCHKETTTERSAYEPYEQWSMMANSGDMAVLLSQDCRLASGTMFTWAYQGTEGTFDYLFIDEAGQVSLADAIVASRIAKNVVLLGDPMQLPHVSKGSHPIGTSLSVLDHLRGDTPTVREDYGLFLECSYRMQPRICAFISEAIYEGRLHSADKTSANRVDSPGLSGNGLFYIPIAHESNRTGSEEEAQRIVAEVGDLLRGTVTVAGKPARPLTQRDILIVAPYNVQRIHITRLLEQAGYDDVAVGTVDKFQGLEAPVVFYSMAASSAQDVPRGMEFLFGRNRFNVAVSRAQCLSVLVCSPELLDAHCHTPEQMALVNLFCAFAESARTQEPQQYASA